MSDDPALSAPAADSDSGRPAVTVDERLDATLQVRVWPSVRKRVASAVRQLAAREDRDVSLSGLTNQVLLEWLDREGF